MKLKFNLAAYAASLLKKEPDLTKPFNPRTQEFMLEMYRTRLSDAIQFNTRLRNAKTALARLEAQIEASTTAAAINEDAFLLRMEYIQRRDGLANEIEGVEERNEFEIEVNINQLIKNN